MLYCCRYYWRSTFYCHCVAITSIILLNPSELFLVLKNACYLTFQAKTKKGKKISLVPYKSQKPSLRHCVIAWYTNKQECRRRNDYITICVRINISVTPLFPDAHRNMTDGLIWEWMMIKSKSCSDIFTRETYTYCRVLCPFFLYYCNIIVWQQKLGSGSNGKWCSRITRITTCEVQQKKSGWRRQSWGGISIIRKKRGKKCCCCRDVTEFEWVELCVCLCLLLLLQLISLCTRNDGVPSFSSLWKPFSLWWLHAKRRPGQPSVSSAYKICFFAFEDFSGGDEVFFSGSLSGIAMPLVSGLPVLEETSGE